MKHRMPGEIVKRKPGSGFVSSAEPLLVQVPFEPDYTEEQAPCMTCSEDGCREWASLKIVGGEYDGGFMYHISECQMEDHG